MQSDPSTNERAKTHTWAHPYPSFPPLVLDGDIS